MSDTTKALKYEVIKNRDMASVLNAGNLTSNAESNLSNNQGKLWSNLLGNLEGNIDWDILEQYEDQDKIREALQDHLKKEILKEGQELQKTAKGQVAWSTDKKTRPIMKYTSDIAKIVKAGMCSVLLPGDGKVAARCGILKLCTGTETSLEAITRLIKGIDVAMGKAKKIEYSDILDQFQTLSVHVATLKSV